VKTRDAFKKLGVQVQWGRQRVVLHVGQERQKIVCSPTAFRWLDKLVKWAVEAGFDNDSMLGVIRGSGCVVRPKKGRREAAYRRAEPRFDLQPEPEVERDYDCEPDPEPDRPLNPALDDEFAHGSIILDGVGCYPREDEGGKGRRMGTDHRRTSR
jgi:hypothetical protein